MKPSLRVFLTGLLLGGLVAAWWFTREDAGPLPDEKKVAMELLVNSQAGPGYFHPSDASSKPDEHGIFWIEPPVAEAQIDRILSERKLAPSSREKLVKLIKETSEPHPSRVVGGERINLARLNVALDALH